MSFGMKSSSEEADARAVRSDDEVSTESEQREATGGQAPPVGEGEAGGVAGERGTASVNRVRSLQSRLSNVLAAGLMCALGIGALTWYYAHVFARTAHAIQVARRATAHAASGDAPLPPLGPFSAPRVAAAAAPAAPLPTLSEEVLGPPPELPTAAETAAWNQANALARFNASPQPAGATAVRARPSALDRQLGGPVFAASSGPGSQGEGAASAPPPMGNG